MWCLSQGGGFRLSLSLLMYHVFFVVVLNCGKTCAVCFTIVALWIVYSSATVQFHSCVTVIMGHVFTKYFDVHKK